MSTPDSEKRARQVTQALRALESGRAESAARLLPLVYEQLRHMARSKLAACGSGQTLQATALVHEAWLRCVGAGDPGWRNRKHFFGSAAKAMRNILVDQARRKSSQMRSSKRRASVDPDALPLEVDTPADDILAVHEALSRLEQGAPSKAHIVELRFFAGLSMAEIAEHLDMSLSTVESEWRFARSWLQRQLEDHRERSDEL